MSGRRSDRPANRSAGTTPVSGRPANAFLRMFLRPLILGSRESVGNNEVRLNRSGGGLAAPLPLAGEVGSHRRCDPGGGSLHAMTRGDTPTPAHPSPPPQAGEGAHFLLG